MYICIWFSKQDTDLLEFSGWLLSFSPPPSLCFFEILTIMPVNVVLLFILVFIKSTYKLFLTAASRHHQNEIANIVYWTILKHLKHIIHVLVCKYLIWKVMSQCCSIAPALISQCVYLHRIYFCELRSCLQNKQVKKHILPESLLSSVQVLQGEKEKEHLNWSLGTKKWHWQKCFTFRGSVCGDGGRGLRQPGSASWSANQRYCGKRWRVSLHLHCLWPL